MPHPDTAIHGRNTPDGLPPALVVRHARLAAAEERLLEVLEDPYGPPIPLLIGAPGAGKTTVLQLVERHFLVKHLDEMGADPNFRPVIAIEAPAPRGGSFDWNEGLVSIQLKLGEAGLGWREGDPSDPDALLRRQAMVRRARGLTQTVSETVAALKACRTKVLLVDEVGHMAYHDDVERHKATADILKSLSNQTGVRIVCVGAYEALGYRNLSGQLIRRQTDIHLPRYRAEHPKEYAEFCRVAVALLEAVEFAGNADALLPSLYRGSIGAIGNLAGWLRAAAFRASRRGEPFERALAATRKPDDALATLAREAIAGERAMEQSPEVRSELDELLRLSDLPAATAAPTGRRSPRRPGIRKPTRDPVGVSHAAN